MSKKVTKLVRRFRNLFTRHDSSTTNPGGYENVDKDPRDSVNSSRYSELQDDAYEEISDSSIRKDLFVVAMDFGTSASGYAFSIYDEYRLDPLRITTFGWPSKSDGFMHYKTLTTVLLDPHGQFDSFGYDAEWKYASLDPEENSRWFYFQNFKMELFKNKELTRDVVIYDITGKPRIAMEIFAHAISYLRSHFMSKVSDQVIDVRDDDIYWVLTVPAIWSEKAKQFMREAAEKAGIKNSKLSISLEPEAAALYCRHLPVSKHIIQGDRTAASAFLPGSRYLVVDVGGGTVDITAHRILENGALEELISATGGDWGSNYINEEFVRYFESITVSGILTEMKQSYPDDYVSFMTSFENKKRVFSCTDEFVHLAFPGTLAELLEKKMRMPLQTHLQKLGVTKDVRRVRDKLKMSGDIFRKLLKSVVDKIILNIRSLLANNENNLKIGSIILVGGFAECSLLREELKTNFPDQRLVIPQEPVLAVLKGAVLHGRNPRVLVARVCRYTYGIRTNQYYKEGEHSPEKVMNVGGRKLVKDIFKPHIFANQVVKLGEKLPSKLYMPSSEDQKELNLNVYATKETKPMYVTDSHVTYLGSLTVQIPPNCSRPRFHVRFILDGTELEVSAEDKSTGEKGVAKFDFLG